MAFIRYIIAGIAILAGCHVSALTLMDPSRPQQIIIPDEVSTGLTHFATNAGVSCQFAKGTRGWVIGSEESGRLLTVFDREVYEKACGKLPKGEQPLAWVAGTGVEVQTRDLGTWLGDGPNANAAMAARNRDVICKSLESVEGMAAPAPSSSATIKEPCRDCQAGSSLGDLAQNMRDLGAFALGNRCFINGKYQMDDPKCSFSAMYTVARKCPEGDRQTCNNRCVDNLRKMACQNSPWKDLDLKDRFHLVMDLATPYAKKNGIDVRYIPCVSWAETGYLEPMARAWDSCRNVSMYSASGIGMTTSRTMGDLIVRGGFRSSNPWLKLPSFYVCRGKLHNTLGASPDLQLEVMAFHLGNVLKTFKSPATALASYGTGSHYGHRVLSCVSCLKERANPDGSPKGSLDPLECLAAAPEGGAGVPSSSVYKTFDQYKADHCGGTAGGGK